LAGLQLLLSQELSRETQASEAGFLSDVVLNIPGPHPAPLIFRPKPIADFAL
jgi:hypothetical protein